MRFGLMAAAALAAAGVAAPASAATTVNLFVNAYAYGSTTTHGYCTNGSGQICPLSDVPQQAAFSRFETLTFNNGTAILQDGFYRATGSISGLITDLGNGLYSGSNFVFYYNTWGAGTPPPGAYETRLLASTFSVSSAPEPGTWAMLVLGFGLIGFAMRRRQAGIKTTVRFA